MSKVYTADVLATPAGVDMPARLTAVEITEADYAKLLELRGALIKLHESDESVVGILRDHYPDVYTISWPEGGGGARRGTRLEVWSEKLHIEIRGIYWTHQDLDDTFWETNYIEFDTLNVFFTSEATS